MTMMIETGVPEGTMVASGEFEMFMIERGSGFPTVFLHGGGPGNSAWTDWAPVVPYLSDRRMLMFDLLQYGQSSKPSNVGPIWTFNAKHIALALDSLGVERADFVCSSVGGSAALAFSADNPGRARRIVLSGSQPTMDDPWEGMEEPAAKQQGSGAHLKYYGGDGPTFDKAREIMAELEWYDGSKVPDESVNLRLAQSMAPEIMAWNGVYEARGEREDLTAKLPDVDAEVLFFLGREDPFVSVLYCHKLTYLIPKADIYLMSYASHHHFEERPADYSNVVKAFLDRPE